MREFQRIILGASCRAVGELLKSSGDDLIIERSASIGGEHFDSYRRCSNWERKPSSAAGKAFYEAMEARGLLSGESSDCYGLAPLVYERLKGFESKFMLTTELLGVKTLSRGFELEICNQSGHETLRCQELVDNSLRCASDPAWGRGNIASKSLNAAIFVEDSATALSSRIEGASIRPGRNAKEVFLSCPLSPEAGWAEARAKLLAVWESRCEALKSARIESVAKEFDCSFKKSSFRFDDGRLFLSCVAFSNPLEAIDCGLGSAN